MRTDKAAANAQPTPADAASPDTSGRAVGVSEFLGGVLSQLSLSSWLPATMLVCEGAVLFQMHVNRTDVGKAIVNLVEMPWGTLVVLLFALVLGTMVTQAFEFEVIRLLEGYIDVQVRWVQKIVDARICRHRRKHDRIRELSKRREHDAHREVLALMDELGYSPGYIGVVKQTMTAVPYTEPIDEAERADAAELPWGTLVSPQTDYRIASLYARKRDCPEPHRVMPTRLGNVLRAVEDSLGVPGTDLEGFVIRHHDSLPQMLRDQHRDYRTRLDMYCTLTLVFGILSALSLTLLPSVGLWSAGVMLCGLNALLGAVSYEAAVASARGYAVVLREIYHAARPPDAPPTLR